MRVEKQIKGEKFRFYVSLVPKKMEATVRYFLDEAPVIARLSEDFKYLILPKSFVSPYISGFGRVPVGKLKLNRQQQADAKDYNGVSVPTPNINSEMDSMRNTMLEIAALYERARRKRDATTEKIVKILEREPDIAKRKVIIDFVYADKVEEVIEFHLRKRFLTE